MEEGKGKDAEQEPQSLKLPEDDEPLPPDPVIEYYKKFVDRDLLRANLKLTVDQRFDNLEFRLNFADEFARRLELILGLPHEPQGSHSFE
jgi:hypothetical protein